MQMQQLGAEGTKGTLPYPLSPTLQLAEILGRLENWVTFRYPWALLCAGTVCAADR